MNTDVIENDMLRIVCLPEFGGRISELTDLRTGRNWIVPGETKGSHRDDAVFGVEQAVGWDECFPSVAACDIDAGIWSGPLRDHGALWGRAATVQSHAVGLLTKWQGTGYELSRDIRLDGEELHLSYCLRNNSNLVMPFLWSQHLLLSVTEEDQLRLPSLDHLQTAFLSHHGKVHETVSIRFPNPDVDGLPDLGHGHPVSEEFAAKLFAAVPDNFVATIKARDGEFSITWGSGSIGYLGLWLDYGGWPEDEPVRQVCIAPTTAPTESLADAITQGQAIEVPAKSEVSWTMTIRVSDNGGLSK